MSVISQSSRRLRRAVALVVAAAAAAVGAASGASNVLLIAVDDLRPEIGAFRPWSPGDTVITPNIDALAARGTLFAFKNAGFHTESYGKVFHVSSACYKHPVVTGGANGCLIDPASWSAPAWLPDPYEERGNQTTARGRNPTGGLNPNMLSWVAVDADDDDLPDGNISAHAVAALGRIGRDVVGRGARFFLGVGFLKPHLPQVFPRRYLDMYENISTPTLAANPFPPKGSPSVAWSGVMQEISEYANIQAAKGGNTTAGPFDLPRAVQAAQKLAYHACSTYVDAQIGRVLEALDAQGLRKSTIVALIGDHGWKLGEHGGWAKKTNFYNDARGLLIVSDPLQLAAGRRVDTVVEYLDLMPTLIERAISAAAVPSGVEGRSFGALLDNSTARHRDVGFYQYTCGVGAPSCMGYSAVSVEVQARYTEWVSFDRDTATPDFDRPVAVPELYDHNIDAAENINVADDPTHEATRKLLSAALRANFGPRTAVATE